MSIALWCVLIGGLTPLFVAVVAKAGAPIDNHAPYDAVDELRGYRRRAFAAHLNAFEAFPLFVVAVIVAQMQTGHQAAIDALALVWVILRLAYVLCYLANMATPRTLIWTASTIVSIAIFTMTAWA
jgi:uncharacterized MAPEG superfamily protein